MKLKLGYFLFISVMLLIQLIGMTVLSLWCNFSKDVVLIILISWSTLWAILNGVAINVFLD